MRFFTAPPCVSVVAAGDNLRPALRTSLSAWGLPRDPDRMTPQRSICRRGRRLWFRSCSGRLGGGFRFGLALLAGKRPLRVVARGALAYAGSVKETQDAIGRRCPLGKPALGLLEVELNPVRVFLRQQRVEIAEPLDETPVTRITAIRHHDVINGPLLDTDAGHPDFQGHLMSFL